MKRLFTLHTMLFLIAATAIAGPISPEKAQEIASAFWKKMAPEKAQIRMRLAPNKSRSTDRNANKDSEENYYIFTEESSTGFVIVSGDDLLEPIVGYSTSETRTDAEMPQPLSEWLEMYSLYVDRVREGKEAPIQRTTGKRIEPMMKSTWGQNNPYNRKCPQINNQLPPTGCTATAVAQVMKFHAWPVTPLKAITWKSNITGSSERIDLTKRTYKWNKMLNSYSGMYDQENADEVAQLMVDVGKAINSSYALAGTGSNNVEAVNALVNVFDYSSEARIYRRVEHTDETWMNVLRSNLEARQPIVYTGFGFTAEAGHAFVCDGIDENNYLHINWGWDGAYDGFFDMAYMKPDGIGTGGGAGQYSVGQAIVANIHPRQDGETKREGDPTVYLLAPVGLLQETALDNFEATINSKGVAKFRILAQYLNWSHSTYNIDIAADITDEAGNVTRVGLGNSKFTLKTNTASGLIYTFQIQTKNNTDGLYLPKGEYTMRLVYKHSGGQYALMPGANNGISIEVTDKKVIVKNALPKATLSRITFLPRPMFIGDKINMEARIVNKNKDNRYILVIPVLNKQNSDGTWTSEPQTNSAKLMDLLDNQDIVLPFSTNIRLSYSGKYFISFAYNLRNSYLDSSIEFDTTKMYFVEGTSDTLDIKAQPSGAFPAITEYSTKDINNGSATNIRIRLNNAATNGETYSGTLGVFVQNNISGKEYLLHTETVENLRGGGNKVLKCSTMDYFPSLPTGLYLVDVRELKDGKWDYVRHTVNNSYFTIKHKEIVAPYVSSLININDGKVVLRNESFDVKTSLSSVGGDFNGYIKVNTLNGLEVVAESDYIPVNITEGSNVEVTIPCRSGNQLGRWRLSIKYYTTEKVQQGEVSNNITAYPFNGQFWIVETDDGTAISETTDNDIYVSADNGCIKVLTTEGEPYISVFTADGRSVYQGYNTSIEVARGLYIVKADNRIFKIAVK